MNYHIVYNNFKDYAEIFIKNIDFSKANINKVLFLHIGDEEAISEIIENTNFKNAEFYIKDEDSIYDIIETLYSEKVHKFLEYNNMEFDLIIANPPYGSLGNPIISEAITHLTDNGTASVLMPLSCYKKKELYRHVETFELANPKLFKDAVITENLCICKVKKCVLDKYSWMDLVLKSVDQRYIEFYKWNIAHNKGLVMRYARDKSLDYFNKDLDFLETARCTKPTGGGFGKNGIGYKWNILHNYSSVNSHIGQITFETAKARNNFATCWYSGDNSRKHLLGKAASGMNIQEVSAEYYFFIPQIDWSNIHINQKELWDKGLYDEAVLAEMHLKWNEDKTKIIQA